mgnify:CR=1 FL=1
MLYTKFLLLIRNTAEGGCPTGEDYAVADDAQCGVSGTDLATFNVQNTRVTGPYPLCSDINCLCMPADPVEPLTASEFKWSCLNGTITNLTDHAGTDHAPGHMFNPIFIGLHFGTIFV